MNFCGSTSGKYVNKIEKTGLIPLETENKNVYFKQARLVIECEKLYSDFIDPQGFTSNEIPENIYPKNDFHKMYIGKILKVLVREN